MDEQLKVRLIELAKSTAWGEDEDEDFCVDDYAGGNVDDAFEGGVRAGEIQLARDILEAFGISYAESV